MVKRFELFVGLLLRPAWIVIAASITVLGNFDTILSHWSWLRNLLGNYIVTGPIKDVLQNLSDNWLYIFLIAMIFALSDGAYRQISKYQWAEPNVEILNHEVEKYFNSHFYRAARIEIRNNENLDITDCFVTLTYASDIPDRERSIPIVPSLSAQQDRIKWEDSGYSNDKCEVTIPPRDSRLLDVADSLNTFHFNLCSKDVPTNWMIGSPLHTLKIRVDGKFNGKAIKPLYWEGYIWSKNTLEVYEGEETTSEQGPNGEIIQTTKQVANRFPVTEFKFQQGIWAKDKRLPAQFVEKKKEVFNKDRLFRVRDKVFQYLEGLKKPTGKNNLKKGKQNHQNKISQRHPKKPHS